MATYPSQIAKITDNLYLSSFVGANEFNIMKFNISCVITVCKEVPKCSLKNIESIKVEVVYRQTESLSKYFDVLADKINDVAKRNSASLVHCVAGISRSASIVLAYLMKYLRMNLKDAHSLVKSRRPLIRPNLVNILYKNFYENCFQINLMVDF
jgi:protein-tyrosine phosphatase